MELNKLAYVRQFLLSPLPTNELIGWNHATIGSYNIYSHPLLNVAKVSKGRATEIVLLGYIINPHNPEQTNVDIINTIAEDVSLSGIANKLYYYSGRFVLVIKEEDKYYIYNDPCGLRSVVYTKHEGKIFAASQPLLFKKVFNLPEGKRYKEYFDSSYVKTDIEFYRPTGCSLFENVYQLIPNHYFDFDTCSSIRYWPFKQLQTINVKDAAVQSGDLLKKIMLAHHKRFKLALPITAGFDSRIVLSACKSIADELFIYTLQYRDLKDDSMDIKVPRKLLSKLGLKHHVIDCRNNETIDPLFEDTYRNNSYMSHFDDWGKIAYGMIGKIPGDRVVVKGNCAEIVRCAYYMSGKHLEITSPDQILNLEPGWGQIDFIRQAITDWLKGVKKVETEFSYDIVDMFYWEQRLGNWQAQSQLEWDVVQEAVTPFNNRELLDIGLGVSNDYKCKPHFYFFPMIAEYLWKETLSVPINPRPFYHKLKVLIEMIRRRLILLGK